jgi:hypothetical protein
LQCSCSLKWPCNT